MFGILRYLLLSPDEAEGGGASDGTENTGASAETENTGSGQDPRPSSGGSDQAQREKTFRSGMARGVAKTLRDLGFDTSDLDEARDHLDTLRARTESAQAPEEIQDLRRSAAKLERDLVDRDKQIQALTVRADVARKLAIQKAAVELGIGTGKQADAFVRLYGDRFALSADGDLEALTMAGDGEPVPGIVEVPDLIRELAEESPFLVARSSAAGAGSRRGAVGSGPTEADAQREQSKALWGQSDRRMSAMERRQKAVSK